MKRRVKAARPKTTRRRYQRLPKSVNFGRGYIVKIVFITPSQMVEDLEEEDHERGERSPGYWDVDSFTIWIDSTKSRAEQWDTLFHEEVHAINDIVRLNRLEFPERIR